LDQQTVTLGSLMAGLLLLVFGRRLFWLFVAVVGFYGGMTLAARLTDSASALLLVGVIVGLIGAALAVFLQRGAVLLGGFMAGGTLLTGLIGSLLGGPGQGGWLPFLIGGILGAILMSVVFDWALMILSSLLGAVLVAAYVRQAVGLAQPLGTLLIVGLFIIGFVLQSRFKQG
jgi:hypothetical protein